jgi:hypothetical protein
MRLVHALSHSFSEIEIMKSLLRIVIYVIALRFYAYSQGIFLLFNPTAPTRLDSIGGPLAGPGIWAHAVAGRTADSLEQVGVSVEHIGSGITYGITTVVPWALPGETIFVQMAAWNGAAWGTNLINVPANQLGRTDTVRVFLVPGGGAPPFYPEFTEPAVVPPIPEPSGVNLLAALGGLVVFFSRHALFRTHPTDR